jgi:hypothetical protein
MREGGCVCGAIRYRVEGEPSSSGICHCRTCRRIASAPTLPFVTFKEGEFAFTHGQPVEFASSPPVRRTFCGSCGSPLTYRSTAEPGTVDVMTCSLDEPEAWPPTFHVWTSHKLGWENIADGLAGYATTRAAAAKTT